MSEHDFDNIPIDTLIAAQTVAEENDLSIREVLGVPASPPPVAVDAAPTEPPRPMRTQIAPQEANAMIAKWRSDAAAGATGVDAALAIVQGAEAKLDDAERERLRRQDRADTDPKLWTDAERAEATERQHAAANTCRDAADWLNEPDEPDNPLINGLIEVGSLAAIVGPAKAAKSWLAEQLAVCIATGTDFFGRKVKRQRVYYANVEISARQFKKRLRSICGRLGVAAPDLRGWLFVENLRGHTATWKWCHDEAIRRKAEAVIIDPFYQVFKGCETNEADCQAAVEEMKKFLAAGMTTFIVFHAPKGYSGDRQIVDMISGSSVLVRFPENVLAILPHASDKTARVVDCSVLRDYPPPDPYTVKFDEGALVAAPEIPPVLKSGQRIFRTAEEREADREKREDAERGKLANCVKSILDGAGDKLLSVSELKDRLAARHIGKHKVEDYLRARLDGGDLKKCDELERDGNGGVRRKPKRDGGKVFISTPERIDAYLATFDELEIITSQSSQTPQ